MEEKKNIVMLAHKYSEKRISFPMYVQPKIDGIRAVWKHQEKVFRTRNNIIIEGLPTLTKALSTTALEQDLDGEVTVPGQTFNATSGIVRRLSDNIHEKEGDAVYTVFDLINGFSFADRLIRVRDIFKSIPELSQEPQTLSLIRLIKTEIVTHEKEIEQYHINFNEQGYEGSIYRTVSGKYERKRSFNLLKRKDFLLGSGKVIKLNEGEGKYVGMLGAFTVEIGSGTDAVQFEIGTGLNDNDRNVFWNKDFIGKTLHFKYQNLSEYRIPRFPVFLGIEQ